MSSFVHNHKTFQQVICLLVCVCAWRGPVPVLHDHHALTDSDFQFRHAKAFHAGHRIDEVVGLHWHLGFPEDVTGEKCPPRDEAASEVSLFACASAATTFESCITIDLHQMLCGSAECFESGVSIPDTERQYADSQPRSFLQTLLTEVPLSAVTGVSLI